MLNLRHIATFLPFLGLVACTSIPHVSPEHLRFQDKEHGRVFELIVVRDQKLCADDTKEEQNCPTQLLIDGLDSGHFYINNQARYFLKDEKYNFKLRNCTDECRVCEAEISPSELKNSRINLSLDDHGLPLMLNEENQLLCREDKQERPVQPLEAQEVVTNINLAADTLFKFDKSSLNDLLPKGRLEVIDVATKIKNNYVKVSNINLTGHTDRLGDERYNLNLGEKRAETVRRLLIENGVPASIIQAKSAGEMMPITDGCTAVLEREALKECLQPDRRVTVEITGISK